MHAGKSIIGIDLGGTKTALARFDASTLEIQDERHIATPVNDGFTSVIENLIVSALDIKTPNLIGIGIGVPGLVTVSSGSIITLPNIPGAEGFELKKVLKKRLNLPIFTDNDANCFALAEALHGAGKGYRTVIGVTLGTGVGGGIVINGTIYHGDRGYAGEIGHMLLKPGEPPYETDDKRGDVEQFFSGSAFAKRCADANKPSDYLEGNTCSFMHDDVEREIAWMCVNLSHLLDPGVIVFGGSAGRALAPHLDGIGEKLGKWLLPGTPKPEIAVAALPNSATLGAALLVHQNSDE